MSTVENPYTILLNTDESDEREEKELPSTEIKKTAVMTTLKVLIVALGLFFIVLVVIIKFNMHVFHQQIFKIDGCANAENYLGKQIVMISPDSSVRYERVYTITDIYTPLETKCDRALIWKSFDTAYLTQDNTTREISEEMYRSLRKEL